AILHTLDPTPSRLVEVSVLVAANLTATLVRFLLFRAWVFRSAPASSRAVPMPATNRPDGVPILAIADAADPAPIKES
ncbi:MAG TPA: glycosyltransferase family 2 protein, partial [Actinomycetes bacterium]|nr:glycosyltransferase family 2 protein [Actinomycetes bacterium]